MSWHTCQYNIVMSVVKRASCSGKRKGGERGGPKRGGRERRERDGDSRDDVGQKIYSSNACMVMKKTTYIKWRRTTANKEVRGATDACDPMCLNINDLKCSANSLSLSLYIYIYIYIYILYYSSAPLHTHTLQTFSQPTRFAALQQNAEDFEDNDSLPILLTFVVKLKKEIKEYLWHFCLMVFI